MAHAGSTPGWTEANQRHLAAALGVVRARLETKLEKKEKPELMRSAEAELARAQRMMPSPPAIDLLTRTFGLSPFERELILLVAGIELSSVFAELCASLLGDPHKSYATFGLALSVLPQPHWSALTPASPLRRWRLIEQHSGQALTSSALRIDDRVLGHLTGLDFLDERLSSFLDRLEHTAAIAASHQHALDRWASAWRADGKKSDWPIVQLIGPTPSEKRALARAAGTQLGLEVYAVDAYILPATAVELDLLCRAWMREAMLRDAALLVSAEAIEASDVPRSSALKMIAEKMNTPLIIALRERRFLSDRPTLSLDVMKPSSVEQITLWKSALGARAEIVDGAIEELVSSFDLGASEIRSAQLYAARDGGPANDKTSLKRELWRACRTQARPQLDELAQRIEGNASWEDIVLPAVQREILRDVVAHVRHRRTVYETWNFAAKGRRGLGIGALFAGVSGTGKTMAAEVLASELELDLYRVDLSQVVSKYIGETEKNLRRIFDAAESGGVILLFDEADALFGKRSEVKDSHDRYANIEISYLLQRMESYRGLAILTTNMKDALDTAFLRRLRFVVQFPFPDLAQRAEIWRRVFPKETPTENLDVDKLAKLAVAGGNIRNVALYATFIAANEGSPVKMIHLHRAARVELAKLERAPTEAEIGGWR